MKTPPRVSGLLEAVCSIGPAVDVCYKFVRYRNIAPLRFVWIVATSAVILAAPDSAWSDLFVQANVRGTNGAFDTSSSFTGGPISVAVPGASASATAVYGGVTGSTNSSDGEATAQARFSDIFSFVNAGTHTLTVGFTTNASVNGAIQTGDFADFQLTMTLEDLEDSTNKASAFYELDIEGGDFTTTGGPLLMLTLDLPENHQAELSVQFFLDAKGRNGDSATATDPTSVWVPTTGYTATSGTVYPTSAPVPEPGSLILVSFGLASLAALTGWRKRSVIRPVGDLR